MTWQRVYPTHLRQEEPDRPELLFWEPGPSDFGSLLLWLRPDGQVAGFQLAHARSPGGTEYFAEWREGGDLRVGEVDSGEASDERGPRLKMTPIVRSSSPPAAEIFSQLLDYFHQNAGVLEPSQRVRIAAVLGMDRAQ